MKRQIYRKLGSPYGIALFFTLAALFVFAVTEPVLSAAGDINIAEYLASEKIAPGFFFISPVLAYVLRLLNAVVRANWWALFSVAVMFGGLFVFLWFINRRFAFLERIALLWMDGLFALFFWELMLRYDINFTQTTVIAGLSGMLIIFDCCYADRTSAKHDGIKTLAGVLLLLTAGAVRWKALLLLLPFGVMCLGYFFLFPYTASSFAESLRDSFINRRKYLLYIVIVTAAVFASFGLHKLYGVIDPDLGEYVKANALREEICDYADRYPSYESSREAYEDLGIQQSWINMVNAFITGDENHFSSADLEKMTALKQAAVRPPEDFTNSLKGHAAMWISLLALLVFAAYLNGAGNSYLPLIGCLFAFLLCGVYFLLIGRIEWRVTNGCILACALSFLAMSFHLTGERNRKRFDLTQKTAILALTALTFAAGLASVRFEKEFSIPRPQITDAEAAAVHAATDANFDTLYINIEDASRYYDAHNLWSSHEPGYMDNSISLVAHFTIGEKEMLRRMGVHNIVDDMLTKPRLYVRYYSADSNGILLAYLRDYYDQCTAVSIVERYGGVRYLRYTVPMAVSGESGAVPSVQAEFTAVADLQDDGNIASVVRADLKFDVQENGGGWEDYYLNVEDAAGSFLYSYGLKADETGCSAEIIRNKGTWEDAQNIRVSLVGRTADGSMVRLADVTEEFLAASL